MSRNDFKYWRAFKRLRMVGGSLAMPQLCFGTVQSNLAITLHKALELGYRHIDGADGYQSGNPDYFNIIADAIKAVRREDLWITWKSDLISIENINKTLKRLDCQYFDLYLVHHGCGDDIHFNVLKQAQAMGLIRYYGVSNCENFETIQRLKADHNIFANQIQARPPGGQIKGRRPLVPVNFIEACNAIDVHVMIFSTIGSIYNALYNGAEFDIEYFSNNANNINKYYMQKYLIPFNNAIIVSSASGDSIIANFRLFRETIETHDNLLDPEKMHEIEQFLTSFQLDRM